MTKDQIKEIIIRHSEDLFGVGEGHISSITLTRLGRLGFHITDSPRHLCKAIVKDDHGNLEELEFFIKNRSNVPKEYENMTVLWDNHYHKSDRFKMPQPIFIDMQASLLFLENIEGETFWNLLYNGMIRRKIDYAFLDATVGMAAEWLADFQSIYTSQELVPIPANIRELTLDSVVFNYLSSKERLRIVDCIKDIQRDEPTFHDTYVHDQYLFRNMIFKPNSLWVVDFPNMWKGWPYFDLYRFTLGIDRLIQYPFVSIDLRQKLKKFFVDRFAHKSQVGIDSNSFNRFWGGFVAANIERFYPTHKGIRGANE